MRISELSERSGVSIPTIKYYIREGLVPPGERTAPTQADYGEDHVRRLALIRSLREGADLPVSAVARTLAALDEPASRRRAVHIETALRALESTTSGPHEPGPPSPASEAVSALVDRLGWQVEPGSAGWATLVAALETLDIHWPGTYTIEGLERYAAIAAALAEVEIPSDWSPGEGGEDSLVYAVLGTVLFEPVILGLRRLAHVDRHRRAMQPSRTS